MSRPKQTILGCLFADSDGFADSAQPHAVVVAQLENDALVGGKLFERGFDPASQRLSLEGAVRVALDARFLGGLERIEPLGVVAVVDSDFLADSSAP